jgi:hypothetical protein
MTWYVDRPGVQSMQPVHTLLLGINNLRQPHCTCISAGPDDQAGLLAVLQATLVGLWLMPPLICVQLHFWRFIVVCAQAPQIALQRARQALSSLEGRLGQLSCTWHIT